MVELYGVLNMETPAVGPAKQENTPQQEKAKTDDGKTFWEIKSVRETGNKAIQESSKMAPPLDVTVGSTNTSCFVITERITQVAVKVFPSI